MDITSRENSPPDQQAATWDAVDLPVRCPAAIHPTDPIIGQRIPSTERPIAFTCVIDYPGESTPAEGPADDVEAGISL